MEIHEDCDAEITRIHELIQRSNQLNFTKIRSSEEEIVSMLSDPSYCCGTVWVSDRFGDYGMVGFYAVKGGKAIHFLFSCRTIGMGIEQYVYQKLGCPEIDIVGEVIAELGSKDSFAWINVDTIETTSLERGGGVSGSAHSVLLKGPCDMEQIFNFIRNTDIIDKEFTYVDRKSGVTMQGPQHTCQILESLSLSEEQKRSVVEELPFASEDFFDTNLFTGQYSVIFLSMLHESHLGIYRRIKDGVKVVFGEAAYPMTEEKYFDDYIKQRVYTGGCHLSQEFLEWFKDNYVFCGHTGVEELQDNLTTILKNLPEKTKLILMLGVEYPCEANTNPAFAHSHEVFAQQNAMIRELAKENDRIKYICYGDYLDGQDGFYKNNYHFTPAVYYRIAEQICNIINSNNGDDILNPVSKKQIVKAKLLKKCRENIIVDTGIRMVKAVQKIGKRVLP